MEATDDFDLSLILHPHGWSTCFIFIEGKQVELTISHVFGDPYHDFIHALKRLMKGEFETQFYWYGEPGGERITINRIKDRQHKIHVTVEGFSESYGDEINQFDTTTEFECTQKAFLTMAYLQLKKIALLMQDSSYSKSRNGDFPFQLFHEFEMEVKSHLSIS